MAMDLFTEIIRIGKENAEHITAGRDSAKQSAQYDRDYRREKVVKYNEFRIQGKSQSDSSVLSDGDTKVTDLKFRRDAADADSKAEYEVVNNNKKIMAVLQSQMEWERGQGGAFNEY